MHLFRKINIRNFNRKLEPLGSLYKKIKISICEKKFLYHNNLTRGNKVNWLYIVIEINLFVYNWIQLNCQN